MQPLKHLLTHWTDQNERSYQQRINPERARMAEQVIQTFEAAIPERIPRMMISEWAEAKRVLPPSLTSLPGPFKWKIVPYMREPVDCLSESSPIWGVAFCKGVQICFTTAVLENWIGYVIDIVPGAMLFVSGDAKMAEASMELRIDNMIESADIGHKIAAQTEHARRTGRRGGDTKSRKEFPGGYLMAIGPRSGARLRGFPIRFLAFDEVDAYQAEIGGAEGGKTANEGDPIALAVGRTATYEHNRKILYGSTPTISGASRIDDLFRRGDQRYYYVPCKHCGEMQRIFWRIEDDHGHAIYPLKYEKDEMGRLIPDSVHYECQKCEGHWINSDKAHFLQLGEWRPTAESMEVGFRSYHISTLYSPIGQQSWESVCQRWLDTREGKEIAKLRVFVNQVLGESFEERGDAPEAPMIEARKEGYIAERLIVDDAGRVTDILEVDRPDRAVICTIGVDIQIDRIECEIVAWGRDKESWSLGYHILPGDTKQPGDTCWRNLAKLITSRHAGMQVFTALIDSGFLAPQAYLFCSRIGCALPSKGDDKVGASRKIYQRGKVEGSKVDLVRLDVNFLKLEHYSHLRIGPPDGKPPTTTLRGYCHFPLDYPSSHYRQITAEHQVKKKGRDGKTRWSWYLPPGRRNEALDCRVYALGALFVLAGATCEQRGLEQLDWVQFWNDADEALLITA